MVPLTRREIVTPLIHESLSQIPFMRAHMEIISSFFFLLFLKIFSEGRVILSLFSFVRANDSSSAVEWSPAQFEELQLQVNISLHLNITINFCKYCVLKRLKNSFEIVRFYIVTHLFFTIYKKKRSERTRTVLIVAKLNSHLQWNETWHIKYAQFEKQQIFRRT